jgi:hypothetical protein
MVEPSIVWLTLPAVAVVVGSVTDKTPLLTVAEFGTTALI